MSVVDRNRLRLVVAVAIGVLLLPALLLSSLGIGQVDSASLQTCVPGPHSGIITGTQEWCAADGLHTLTSDVTIPAGMSYWWRGIWTPWARPRNPSPSPP